MALAAPRDEASARDALAELLCATARGDRAAFEKLYHVTSGRLLAVAMRILGRRDLAEEVLQEAYVTVWTKAAQQDFQHASPFAWMVAIVRHRAIDRLRSARGTESRGVAIDDLDEVAMLPQPLEPEFLDIMSDAVRRCVECLGESQRKAIFLAYYCGMTHEEIAARLESPLGTVKSWVRRGLLQLKECIDP